MIDVCPSFLIAFNAKYITTEFRISMSLKTCKILIVSSMAVMISSTLAIFSVNGNPNFCAIVWQYNKSVPGNPSAITLTALIFFGCKKNDMMLLSSPPDNEIWCELHCETDSSKICYSFLNSSFNMVT